MLSHSTTLTIRRGVLRLFTLTIVNIADAAQESGRFGVTDVFHAMGFQAGNINDITGTANRFLDDFIGLRIKLVAFEPAA